MIKRVLFIISCFIAVCSFADEPYKKYTAIVRQMGSENPVVHVLENNIGDINWTRMSTGYYKGSLIGSFPFNGTWLSISGSMHASFLYGDENDIIIVTRGPDGIPKDGVMFLGAYIEIRIYNLE